MMDMEYYNMLNPRVEKRESRLERSDRIARAIILDERRARDRKTARLREKRLKIERMASA